MRECGTESESRGTRGAAGSAAVRFRRPWGGRGPLCGSPLLALAMLAGCQEGPSPPRPAAAGSSGHPATEEPALPPPSAEELAAIRQDLEALRVRKTAPPAGVAGASAAAPDTAPANAAHGATKSNGGSAAVTPGSPPAATGPGLTRVASALAMFGDAVPLIPAPREVKLLIPNKTFRQEGRDRAWRVSFDDIDLLKVLNMDPVTEDAVDKMPSWLTSLSGQRIRIRGFMYPTYYADGIKRFSLARDNQICCFGRNPQVYDIIEVALKEGSETHYIENRSFDVVGVLRIQAVDGGAGIGGLYYLDQAEVIER